MSIPGHYKKKRKYVNYLNDSHADAFLELRRLKNVYHSLNSQKASHICSSGESLSSVSNENFRHTEYIYMASLQYERVGEFPTEPVG